MRRFVWCLLGWLPAAAMGGELATLNTGAQIEIARHEETAGGLRLFLEGGGYVDLPAAAVTAIETVDDDDPEPVVQAEPAVREPETLEEIVELAAERFSLPRELIHSVIAAESAYDPAAVSHAGAVGLMQLMPATAADLDVSDRTDPKQNVRGGAEYLRQLLDEYEGSEDQLVLALAAYNAGPDAVRRYGGIPPYEETRVYVRRVLRRFLRLVEQAKAGGG